MSAFVNALLGTEPRPSPGQRIMAKLSDYNPSDHVYPPPPPKVTTTPTTTPPSDAASKIARAIDGDTGRWAFEDDQEHAHGYGLGITVSMGRSAVVVWHGTKDQHVNDRQVLFEAPAKSTDAILINDTLKARRARYIKEQQEAAQRARDAEIAARTQRAAGLLEKLGRGECLEEPEGYSCGYLGGVAVSPNLQGLQNQRLQRAYY